MARHHKKSRKTRRRRGLRGGMFPFTRFDGSPWSQPAAVAADGVATTVTDTTKAVAPLVPSAPAQAAAVGVPAGSADVLGPNASMAPAMGGRRRRTRKQRKSRRRH
jgi:hypothetical protein